MAEVRDYEPPMTDQACEHLIDGTPFGAGSAREVFNIRNDPSVVMKRAKTYPMTNMIEWIIWQSVKDHPLAHAFGRCVSISETGRYLIMERLDDLSPEDYADIPRVPVWVNDRKASAFGKSADAIKLRDYGLIRQGSLLNLNELEQVELQRLAEMRKRSKA